MAGESRLAQLCHPGGLLQLLGSLLDRVECQGFRHGLSRIKPPFLRSADGALHLKLHKPIELHGVLQGKLLHERLNEAVDDHHHRLGLA